MISDQQAIRDYFAKLDLETEVADIYLSLYNNGPQSISALARSSKVERTRIYRLIDTLLASNLTEVETQSKRGIIKAAPISNLRILIAEKEQHVKSLQDDLELVEKVLSRNSLSSPATRVQFYQGPEGIRQMQWNLTRSKTEILSIMPEPMFAITGSAFFKRWAETWNTSGQPVRLIYNQKFLDLTNAWHAAHPGHRVKHHTSRMLPEAVMPLTHGVDIYDNVVAYYNWHDNEVFGIEMYNTDIARSQRLFFETLWSQTTDAAKLDNGRI